MPEFLSSSGMKGFQATRDTSSGNGLVGKADFGERELSAEIALFKTRKPFGSSAA